MIWTTGTKSSGFASLACGQQEGARHTASNAAPFKNGAAGYWPTPTVSVLQVSLIWGVRAASCPRAGSRLARDAPVHTSCRLAVHAPDRRSRSRSVLAWLRPCTVVAACTSAARRRQALLTLSRSVRCSCAGACVELRHEGLLVTPPSQPPARSVSCRPTSPYENTQTAKPKQRGQKHTN